jgi:hypothetical protein
VYVEETSFRAKSIEGVGTSTTGFVGPTRKGPVGDTPELITSFGDFERIYGGLTDLSYGVNYLAHAVRAFFNEGGARLYVARVFLASGGGPGLAAANIITGARFVARYPGAAGNGQITVTQIPALATGLTMANAPEGAMLRVGTSSPAGPATISTGAKAPFTLTSGSQLRLTIGAGEQTITFASRSAEAAGAAALPQTVDLGATPVTVQITVNGAPQTINLGSGQVDRELLVLRINGQLRGGYARLAQNEAPIPDNALIIGSDRQGVSSAVTVPSIAALGFTDADPVEVKNGFDATTNNVDNLAAVTAQELEQLLQPHGVHATMQADGSVKLTTQATGAAAKLAVRDAGATSAHNALGLTPIPDGDDPISGLPGDTQTYYLKTGSNWIDPDGAVLPLANVGPMDAPAGGAEFVTLTVTAQDGDGNQISYENLAFDPKHPRWIGYVLAAKPSRRSEALENLYALEIGANVDSHDFRAGLFAPGSDRRVITLSGGDDGVEPTAESYSDALETLEALDDISIVAAPGYSAYALSSQAIQNELIIHVESDTRYRIAVLDTPPELTLSGARDVRSRIDSTRAALYYPWVTVANPLARPGLESVPREINLPPSGFVCGIYARNDVDRGVFKAPANEVVRSALRFESDVNFAQQQVLNPLGVNCLRYFPGRGYRVWGARTASSDPEWKYVNVRRYFNYLESSIDRGTQWAVFEPNGEQLWANIRDTLDAFLFNEWTSGALLGGSPEEAFFVRCDRSTMTQNDLDNGRLICLIGVAVLKPAEFVIFRIGQKTADARS